jgi:hypothetical protein
MSKDLLARNRDNVSGLIDMTTPMDCCSSELRIYYIDPISRFGLVQGGHHYHFIKCNFYSHDKHVSEILLIWRYTTIIHHSF